MITYRIYESGNYLIIDTYDDVARVVTASAQYAKKNSYYNKTADGYVITEFGGGEFPILLTDINDNKWTDNAAVPLSENAIVDILQNHTGNFKSAAGGSAAVGAVLMKTGQVTSYRTGDDGGLQAGRAVDFFTLENAGPFGTKRFTDELGGQTYANNWVIDWSTYDTISGTVLGYYRVLSSGDWNTAIDNSFVNTFGTFNGCRLGNINEMLNICNWGQSSFGQRYSYSPFNLFGTQVWTSSTRLDVTSYAIYLPNSTSIPVFTTAKTGVLSYMPVRTFTVSGTTLS